MSENTVAEDHLHHDLSIDQRLALKTAAANLRTEFGDMLGVETIERFLHSSYVSSRVGQPCPAFYRC